MLSNLKFCILGIVCIFASSFKPNHGSLTTTTSSTDITETSVLPTTTLDPLNTTLASCDDVNCTQFNATSQQPNNDTKANKSEKTRKTTHSKYSTDTNICTCNLQAYVCDINCCCDPDCSAADKTVFKYCALDENRYYDDRYCNYIKYIYVNNTPFEWEVNQDGLFCVISSNLPKSHLIQKEKPIKYMKLLPKVIVWRQDIEPNLDDSFNLGAKGYVFGDPIIVVKNDSTISSLRMPNNLLTQACVFKEDVFFLKDEKHVCSQANIDEDNESLSFPSFFQNFKVISNPKLVNLTKAKGRLYQNCPRNVCIEVEPKLCDLHFNNCSKLENVSQVKLHCAFNLRNNVNICQNAVRKIHYVFFHNGTNGLHNVEVLGVVSNVSYRFGGEGFQFLQDYSMEFIWINQTKNYSQIFSGNPGYVVGKPILKASKLIMGNATSIERNSSNFINNFLAFPDNANGQCIRNETYNVPLNFGYNMMTKCRIEKLMCHVNETATEMCKNVQKIIFDLWGIPMAHANQSLIFGLFGNARPDINEDWSEILYDTDPKKVLNRTLGNMTNKNSTLLCNNISTLLNVDVFYSRVDLATVVNQHKILGITFRFLHARQLVYSLQRKNGTVSFDLSLGLINQVSFHDITSRKERKLADPPSFEIRLPYDFFYPFIKIGSGAKVSRSNVVLVILVFLLQGFILI